MTPRRVPVSRAWTWFMQAINLGARNPRAVFGAAMLLVGSLYLLLIAGTLLAATVGGGGQGTPALALMVLTALAVFMLVPILIGGLMHVIREVENARPARAADIFQPLRSGRAGRLAAFGGLQIVVMGLAALVTRQLVGDDYAAAYMEAVNAALNQQTPQPLPPPAHPLPLFLWQTAVNYFTTTTVMLGIALVALSGLGFGQAVRAALHAALRNLAPNLLAAALYFGALVVAIMILSVIGSLLLLVLGKLFMPLALVVGLLLTLGFISAALVMVCGGGYLIWRDTFGDAEAPPSAPVVEHRIEV
ncbi:hypothetical protein [Luteimonas sp. e5]